MGRPDMFKKLLPIIIETKGFDSLEDVIKAAAERWVKGVNADEKFGHWQYSIVRKPEKIIEELNKMNSQKVIKYRLSSFRRKPESSLFNQLQSTWTPVFTGVTTFCEFIK